MEIDFVSSTKARQLMPFFEPAGGESEFTIEIVAEPAPGDQVIEDGGARVFVDSQVAPILDNVELDARREGDQVAFGLTSAGSNNGSPRGG